MKQYLSCTITAHDGRTWNNPLKLSEAHLITQILKENKSITIVRETCTKELYNKIFDC